MRLRRLFVQMILTACIMAASTGYGFADRVGYSEVFDCRAESSLLSVTHHHDWSIKTRDARWKMISTDENPFTEANTYSYIRVLDRISGKVLFQSPTPALRFLWISQDSKYIVGVSNIKLWNPIQVVVFNLAGNCVFKKQVLASSFEGASSSVSNYVRWYKEPAPKIQLDRIDGSIRLSIESNAGPTRIFSFKDIQ